MSTNAATAQNPRANSTTLGALWIVYAILRLIAVILLVLYAGTATVMFGALLTRVVDYASLMAIFHVPELQLLRLVIFFLNIFCPYLLQVIGSHNRIMRIACPPPRGLFISPVRYSRWRGRPLASNQGELAFYIEGCIFARQITKGCNFAIRLY